MDLSHNYVHFKHGKDATLSVSVNVYFFLNFVFIFESWVGTSLDFYYFVYVNTGQYNMYIFPLKTAYCVDKYTSSVWITLTT